MSHKLRHSEMDEGVLIGKTPTHRYEGELSGLQTGSPDIPWPKDCTLDGFFDC